MSFTSARPKKPVAVYYHTHWDREWYMPFRTYQIRLAEVVDAVLARLEEGSLPCFTLDGQTVVLSDYLELRPENGPRLKRLIEDGRLRVGPWFVMPDEFLVSGESLIRNLMLGIREAREWGCNTFTGYLPDTFGHSADIPAILRNFGLNSAIVWRGVNPETSLFLWRSPGGETVPTLHLTEGYFQMILQDWTLNREEQASALDALIMRLKQAATAGNPILLPVGGDHMEVIPAEGRSLLLQQLPELTETTPERYMSDIQPSENWEVRTGELTDQSGSFLLSGVYSARLYLKQANRRLEHALTRRLEPLLAMAQLFSEKPPVRYPHQELALAWRTLLLNHPHDSICGCSVDAVHRENEQRFEQVSQIAEALEHRAVHALWRQLAMDDCWLVFNTGDRPYTGVIPVQEDFPELPQDEATKANGEQRELHSGMPFPGTESPVLQDEYLYDTGRIPLSHLTRNRRTGWVYAEDIPPYGFRVLPKAETRPKAETVHVSQEALENARLLVRLSEDGTLSITDKLTGMKYARLMRFQVLEDHGDSYNGAPLPPARVLKYCGPAVTEGDGTLYGSLSLTFGLLPNTDAETPEFSLEAKLSLAAGSPVLTLEVAFTNRHWTAHRLEIAFPTGQNIQEVTAESHLGVVQRSYDPDYRMEAHMPVPRNRELNSQTGPIQRFISVNGQSFLTEGLTEYGVRGDTLHITLLRAFQALSSADTGVRGAQAGPPLPTPEGACLDRPARYRLAWLPTPEDTHALYEASARFYGDVWGIAPCWARSKGSNTQETGEGSPVPLAVPAPLVSGGSLVSWDDPALVGMACYFIPERGLALRLLNTASSVVTLRLRTEFPYIALEEVDFLEAVRATADPDQVTFEPGTVKTLLFRTTPAV